MHISNIILVLIYVLDMGVGFAVAGSPGAIIVAVGMPLAIWIQQKIYIFASGAVELDSLPEAERFLLANTFETVLEAAECVGYNMKNPRIFLSSEDTMNAFNCGNCIVVNKPLLISGSLEGIIAHEVKHFHFHDSYTSCLISNTITLFFIGLMIILGAGVFLIVLFTFLVIALVFGSTAGAIVGGVVGKLLNFIKEIFLKVNLFLARSIEMALSRFTEYKADEFAVITGFGSQLKHFLEMNRSNDNTLSVTEQLLSTHPSDGKRIARIERMEVVYEQQLAESDQLTLPYL